MARAPLGALNERHTGDIKTVLNEDIEKLELFLAHNLPDLVCYLVGPVVIFIYLMTVNIPLALISLVPLIIAVVVMGMMFRNTDDLMERANHSITTLNSVMIEYISGMKLIKAYNMGSKSFQKFSDAIQEENAMWNETSPHGATLCGLCCYHRMWDVADGSNRRNVFPQRLTGGQRIFAVRLCRFHVFDGNPPPARTGD